MIKFVLFVLIILISACAYNQYVPEGCELNSYRLLDGTMRYYYTGKNCNKSYDDSSKEVFHAPGNNR